MFFFDAHLHLAQSKFDISLGNFDEYSGVSCSFSESEFLKQNLMIDLIKKNNKNISFYRSFGIHPQSPLLTELDFLESLLKDNKIDAIGECGFDFYTSDLKKSERNQDLCWNAQIELALYYDVPIILHGRKSNHKFFSYLNELKKLPFVIFHSYSGTLIEAYSFLNKNVNAFFSFGKPILNGKKTAIECIKLLPVETLLLETDSPYQTLKGESYTKTSDIFDVYKKANEIRCIDFSEVIKSPFQKNL